jgi:putative ABC transport system substrate-binding protein
MKRREFITLLGGVAAARPFAARAQQAERMRRIGVLLSLAADDTESSVRLTAFVQGLQEFGWAVGHNVRIDTRWGAGDPALFRKYAAELVALAPDVILGHGADAASDTHRADRIRAGHRPSRRWLRREPSAAGRKRHGFRPVRIWHQREMAGTT